MIINPNIQTGNLLTTVTNVSPGPHTPEYVSGSYTIPANYPLAHVTVVISGGPGADYQHVATTHLGGGGGVATLVFAVSPGDVINWELGYTGYNEDTTTPNDGFASALTCSHGTISVTCNGGHAGSSSAAGTGGTASGSGTMVSSTYTTGTTGIGITQIATITITALT